MTLDEASGRFCINMEKLKYYEDNGLLECRQLVDGIPDYTEQELKKVGLLYSLQKAGLDLSVFDSLGGRAEITFFLAQQ